MNMNDGEALVGMKRRGSQLCTYIYIHISQSVGRSSLCTNIMISEGGRGEGGTVSNLRKQNMLAVAASLASSDRVGSD